jgi:hypothetical protein
MNLPPQPDGPHGPKPRLGEASFIGPLPEVWFLNNVGRPEQDFSEYIKDDIDIVISPTMKVAFVLAWN